MNASVVPVVAENTIVDSAVVDTAAVNKQFALISAENEDYLCDYYLWLESFSWRCIVLGVV